MKRVLFVTTAIGGLFIFAGMQQAHASGVQTTTTIVETYDFPDSKPHVRTSTSTKIDCPKPLVCSGGGTGPCSGPGSCFDYHTRVLMADGSIKKIGEIVVGDQTAYGVVHQSFIRRFDQTYMMTEVFQNVYRGGLYAYRGVLVTGNHVVHDHGRWKAVADTQLARPVSVLDAAHIENVYSLDVDGGIIPIVDERGDLVAFLDDKQAFVMNRNAL